MELLIVIGAIVALDVLSTTRGYPTSGSDALEHHARALSAARHGDLDIFRMELARLEREIEDGVWRT